MAKITVESALETIKVIASEDNESAHSIEDGLYTDFIACIAAGEYKSKKEIEEVANAVIKAWALPYERWYV